MNYIGTEKESKLSIVQDPFKKDKVDSISIMMEKVIFSKEYYWYAMVRFKNGNTSGSQRTSDCKTYEQVYIELKQILESL